VHRLSADGYMIWAELPSHMEVPRIRLLRVQLTQADFRRGLGNHSGELRGERTNARGPRVRRVSPSAAHLHRGISCGVDTPWCIFETKHVPGAGKYWIGPHVAEIEPIGMVYDGPRLSVAVCWHAEGISNFRVRP
jgi:hypothetical protein